MEGKRHCLNVESPIFGPRKQLTNTDEHAIGSDNINKEAEHIYKGSSLVSSSAYCRLLPFLNKRVKALVNSCEDILRSQQPNISIYKYMVWSLETLADGPPKGMGG